MNFKALFAETDDMSSPENVEETTEKTKKMINSVMKVNGNADRNADGNGNGNADLNGNGNGNGNGKVNGNGNAEVNGNGNSRCECWVKMQQLIIDGEGIYYFLKVV